MNSQINLRLPEKLLFMSQSYADKHGFGTVQEFIKETLREKLFGEQDISRNELALVKRLIKASEQKGLYGKEDELFKKLRKQ